MQTNILSFCVSGQKRCGGERADLLRQEKLDRQRASCERLGLEFPLRRAVLRGPGRPSIATSYKLAVEDAISNDTLPDSVTDLVPPRWWQKGRPLEATVEEAEAFLLLSTSRRRRDPAGADTPPHAQASPPSAEAKSRPRREYKAVPRELQLWFLEYARLQHELFGWQFVTSLRHARQLCPENRV